MLTAKRLRELLNYNPRTGIFRWRVSGRGRKSKIAGFIVQRGGHRRICINQKIYPAAQLAFLYMTGKWPRRLIDHINCIPDDNRWDNLREATYSQNGGNRRSQNQFKGVCWDKWAGKFKASITVNNKWMHLGNFDRAEDAHAAYIAAARKHFGSFARAR